MLIFFILTETFWLTLLIKIMLRIPDLWIIFNMLQVWAEIAFVKFYRSDYAKPLVSYTLLI